MPLYEIYRRGDTPVQVEGPEGATTRQLINLRLKNNKKDLLKNRCKHVSRMDEAVVNVKIYKRKPVLLTTATRIPKGILAGGNSR